MYKFKRLRRDFASVIKLKHIKFKILLIDTLNVPTHYVARSPNSTDLLSLHFLVLITFSSNWNKFYVYKKKKK